MNNNLNNEKEKEYTMKTKRIISLLLALVICLGALASCNSENPNGGGGDRVGDSWDGVDFKGQEVNFCISVNKYDECMFPAADIYTKGPDAATPNEVTKEVLTRNKAAEETLGITVKYTTKDLLYSGVLEDIQNTVLTSSKTSPDIYNNDIFGLVRAMTNGYLWNVKNPGEGIKNYFDFTKDGWYFDYIKGCTYDQNKLYIFAGDYFIDMIRMAWVVLVNNDLLSANLSSMPEWCTNVDEFYAYVGDGAWDLDVAAEIAGSVFADKDMNGIAESTDTLVGLAINSVTPWIVSAASQITLFYQDAADNYKPKMMQDTNEYQKVADKYVTMLNSRGVCMAPTGSSNSVLECTKYFLNGNVLFAYSRLGELEAEGVRNFTASKGLVPTPKWNQNEQMEYHTAVHDQAELGCILNTAKAFSAASALMQYLNEESEKVVYAYYEKGLKFKYNDDKNTRDMMDIVRDTTDSPFSWQVGWACLDLYTGTPALTKLYLYNNTTVSSTFAAEKDAYADCLRQVIERFEKFE